jgi:hypothetical protein
MFNCHRVARSGSDSFTLCPSLLRIRRDSRFCARPSSKPAQWVHLLNGRGVRINFIRKADQSQLLDLL